MRHENAIDIPYPTTVGDAHEAFNELVAFFGNGERLSFDIKESDKESVCCTKIALDELNDTISIFHFFWVDDEGFDRALDVFSVLHLDKDEAIRVADILKYFIKIIEDKGKENNND